jgi:hypothetical protein
MENNLIPGDFIYKLFDQVKESSKKNSEDIENLANQTSIMADAIRDLKTIEISPIKENCKEDLEISRKMEKFCSKYESVFNKIDNFELEKFKKEQDEKLKILRWLSLKFKIVIAIITAFFLLTGGSYIVVKYFTYNDHSHLVELIKKENENLRIEIKNDNDLFREEIKNDNEELKNTILKKIKKIHPDLVIDD